MGSEAKSKSLEENYRSLILALVGGSGLWIWFGENAQPFRFVLAKGGGVCRVQRPVFQLRIEKPIEGFPDDFLLQ